MFAGGGYVRKIVFTVHEDCPRECQPFSG
jgi:hypothetical protein